MRLLTVRQPWATLLVRGDKHIETRSWRTRYTGRLFIHAAQGPLRYAERLLADELGLDTMDQRITLGAIVGSVDLIRCVPIGTSLLAHLDPREFALGDYRPGRFAWLTTAPEELAQPRPWVGRLGLWQIPDDLWDREGGEGREQVAGKESGVPLLDPARRSVEQAE